MSLIRGDIFGSAVTYVIGSYATYSVLRHEMGLPLEATLLLLIPAITLTSVFMFVRYFIRYKLLVGSDSWKEELSRNAEGKSLSHVYLRLGPFTLFALISQLYAIGYILGRHDLMTGVIIACLSVVALYLVGRTYYYMAPLLRPMKQWFVDGDKESESRRPRR
jgi:hypothetical protein